MDIRIHQQEKVKHQEQIKQPEQAQQPAHIVPLPGGDWTLWRCMALRGAGFAISEVLKLSSPLSAAAADSVLDAEQEARDARQACMSAVNAGLDALRQAEQWDDESRRAPLVKALHSLRKNRVPEHAGDNGSVSTALANLKAAGARVKAATSEFATGFQHALEAHLSAIQEVARGARFCEAIIWQNRRAYHSGIESLHRARTGSIRRGFKQRQREELIANYLQRYCVKNDTIGFFGPVGWASFTSRPGTICVEPGPDLLAARNVYFEAWGIDAIADILAKSKLLRPWMTPRLAPFIRLEEGLLYSSLQQPYRLNEEQEAVLRGIDGERTARQVAAVFNRSLGGGPEGEQRVYKILEQMQSLGWLSWDLSIAYELNPDRSLRRMLERIEDQKLRAATLGALNRLDADREAVGSAAGEPGRLDKALETLEAGFNKLTRSAPTRASGNMYAARTLIYEDCRRDIKVELGEDFLQSLGPPLSLLLKSARWLSFQISKHYRQSLNDIFTELARKAGKPVVDATDFWLEVQPRLFDREANFISAIVPGLQQRWHEILAFPPDQRRVAYTSEELRPRVDAAFDAPEPGWSLARYHSPDVMISASGVEALKRGQYELVLGEFHLAANTLCNWIFMSQQTSPEDLIKALDMDLPGPRIVPITPKSAPGKTVRTSIALISPHDYLLEYSLNSPRTRQEQTLPISTLVVEDSPAGLRVRTRDGRVSFDVIEFIGYPLTDMIFNSFKMLGQGRHTPRINIDRLVIWRETWRFEASEMPFADEEDESLRFLTARRWARANGLPRFVFVKTPVELKPFYVDFDSPTFVNILSKMVNRAKNASSTDPMVGYVSEKFITISEMLPAPDQLWLPDAAGNYYTSELRIIAVDMTS